MFMLKLCSLMSWCFLYVFSLETCHITPELWLCAMFYHNSLHLCIICALKWQLKWIFHNVKRSFDSLGRIGYFKSQFGKTVFTSQANTTLLEPSTGKIWQWGTTKMVHIVVWCIFCKLLQIKLLNRSENHSFSKEFFRTSVHLNLKVMTMLNNWIKKDQLDVTCFIVSLFNAQHVSDVNTSILRSLRLICWVISYRYPICIFVHIMCHNSDIFPSILIILRELLTSIKHI